MGSKAFQVLQLGAEGTPFTAVPATTKWRGPGGSFEDMRETVFPEENVAIAGGTDRSYTPSKFVEINTAETEVSFEQTPQVMRAAVAEVSGSQDGTGSDYIYTYPLIATTDPVYTALKTFTAEYGDSVQYQRAEGCVCSEWNMTGKSQEAWKFTSKWFGRQATNVTKTASVALPTVEDVLFQKTKVYLDLVSGNFGTTQLAATLLEASIKCVTGWYPIFTADGELYPSTIGFNSEAYELTLDLTMLITTAAITERSNWEAHTPRLLQLKTESGNNVTTPGTTYSKKTLIQNYAGKWSKFNSVDNQNGTGIVKASFRNAYNATKATRGTLIFVNELASLP